MGVYGGPNKVKGGIVFSLDGANPASYAGDTPTTAGTNYGYWGGGNNPSSPGGLSTVDRVDYSNDTATAATKGPLTDSYYWRGGTSSLTHGYIAGAYAPSPNVPTNNRIDYANDTATAATKGPLSAAVQYRVATGNTSYGYWGSGREGSPFVSSVDRLDYSNDTATMSPKGPLVASHNYRMATGNLSYGYWSGGGGNGPPSITSVDRLDYSSDTTTAVAKGPLSSTRYKGAATGNGDYGYIAGGTPSPYKSSIDRIDYSNDTATAASGKGPLSIARVNFGDAATGTNDYGYWGGGFKAYANISTIDRLDYSSDTSTASVKGPMTLIRARLAAVGSRAYGFPTTGNPATRSITQINGTPYGYFGGGKEPSDVSTVDRIDYSNDTTTASTKGPLSSAKYTGGSTGNTSYGYWGGGGPSSGISTVDRVDYSSDTGTAAVKGPLNRSTYLIAATGNASYGYFAGDVPGSSVSRIDYSSDTDTASPKGPLSYSTFYLGATGNRDYGWFGAGTNSALSTVCRIDYSNDTPTASPKGDLSAPNNMVAATGNASYGYFGAGEPAALTSKVDRIDYSNDTATALVKGPLTAVRSRHGATGDTNYGYFGGGLAPSITSTVDRLDFSNDTTAALKGPLTAARRNVTGASPQANSLGSDTVYLWNDISGRGNNATITDSRFRATDGGYFTFDGTGDFLTVPSTNAFAFGTEDFSVEYWVKTGQGSVGNDYGYNAGGRTPGSTDHTTVDRIDFSNDTATLVAKGPLSENRSYAASITSQSYGYAANNAFTGPRTSVERIDYANDTATGVQKGAMAASSYYRAGSSNTNYGWVSGGPAWSGTTLVDRIDFADDTATALLRGNLSISRHHPQAVGNVSYGYHYGGQNSGSSPGYLSSVERIDYGNDTATATPKGPLTAVTRYGAQTGAGNADYGYVNKVGNITSTTIDRIDYSNDTATALSRSTLQSSPNKYIDATVSTSQYGYWMGGFPSSTLVYRLDFSNDTVAASEKGNTSLGRGYTTGHSSRMHGFPTTGPLTAANIINPDSETGSGYWAHQYDTTFDWNSKYDSAAGPAFAYWAGGDNADTTWYSTVDRVDYASDTDAATPKGSLDNSRRGGGGVSSKTHGYIAGGTINDSSTQSSKVSRIDYANDTATASPVGNLASTTAFNGAVGNTSYGYVNIGTSPAGTTKIERIDYSSDSSTASPKGNLSVVRWYLGAAGNQSYGYFGGGFGPSYSGPHSTVQRIEYASDTSTASPKGPLSYTRNSLSAASNASYVYFGGGFNPVSSQVSRIDISNDTPTAADKGPLNTGRFALEATGTTSFGYFGGGRPTSGTLGSVIDRIDYSNDTPTASPKGPLSAARRYCPAVSALANAFPTGSTELYTCSLSPVNDGEWHNVVMTRVGGTQQTYYDGVGITTTGGTYTDSTNYSGVDGWFIGKGNPAVGGTAFNGDLANITIRKGKGLSSDEVQQNFNALKSRFGV